MKRLVIIGGKLQGTEAAWLCGKAGYAAVLVDRRENVPARGLCGEFFRADVCEHNAELVELLRGADMVLPALENADALSALRRLAADYGIEMAFDFEAYGITSSKLASDRLFHEHGIPSPEYFPGWPGPYIAKPSAGSGSKGVKYIESAAEAERYHSNGWVVQEYLGGRAYSIEVIGEPGRYRTYQITEVHVDEGYDCRMVTCPCTELSARVRADFSATAIRLAELLRLRGIMDVEAVLSGGVMKVLEIDARLPSQTPTAVFMSTGVNLLEELYALFHGAWAGGAVVFTRETPTAYEHIEHKPGAAGLRAVGEGAMAGCSPLRVYENACGADELLTDCEPTDGLLRATLINSAADAGLLQAKRERVWKALIARTASAEFSCRRNEKDVR